MDSNLIQGIVMLALYERESIPDDTFLDYCKIYFGKEEYPNNYLELSELIARTGQVDYNHNEIVAYSKGLFVLASKVFDHAFTNEELEIVSAYISMRQAAFRSVNVFETMPDVMDSLIALSKKIDVYAEKGDIRMFYFSYKLNSFILRATFNLFPRKKELAYSIVKKLNSYDELYKSIEFLGKDTQNV